MDRQQRITFVNSQIVCAQAEIEAMKAANAQYSDDQPYDEASFLAIPSKYLIDHNAVIGYLRD